MILKYSSIERSQGELYSRQTDLCPGRGPERHNRAKCSLFGWLMPMHKAKEYVVVAATSVQFPAIAEYIIVPRHQKLYTLVYSLIDWRLVCKIFGNSVSNHYLCTPDMG